MKRIFTDFGIGLVIAVCLLFSCSKSDFVPDRIHSVKVFSLDSQAQNMGLAQLKDGSLLLFGFADTLSGSRLSVNQYRTQVIKCDGEGNELWTKKLPGPICDIWKILPIGESDFAVFGWSYNPKTLCVARYGATGGLKWIRQKEYGADNEAYSIAALTNNMGDLIAASPTGQGILVSKWGADGNEIFSSPLSGVDTTASSLFPNPYYLAQDENSGKLYVGYTQAKMIGSVGVEYPVLCQVSATGSLDWIGFQQDSQNSYSMAGMVASNGKIHSFLNAGKNKSGVIAYFPQVYGELTHDIWDAGGTFISREKVTDLSPNTYFNHVLATSDQGYLFSGTTNLLSAGLTLNAKMILVKLGSDFKPKWKKVVDTRSQSFGTQSIEADGSYFSSGSHVVGNKVQFQMLVKTK